MKAALVTGGAKRIGADIARSLAKMGYSVAVHYYSTQPDALVEEIKGMGVECESFKCDLSDPAQVALLINKVVKTFPALKVLINNASIFERSTIAETTEELFDRHFSTNLRAPFFLSRDFARSVESGSIINITDAKAEGNASPFAAYLLTKKALDDFTRMAAMEFAPRIRVNGVAPGPILPPVGEEEGERYLERVVKRVPLKRSGTTAEVADAVRFLVENEYVTGQTIFVGGGDNLR